MGFLRLRFLGGVCLVGGLGCGKWFTILVDDMHVRCVLAGALG